ncbi:hypothetical protein GV791_08005 [Nocardia cyriacigeorgica]|uniref:DUF1902 domain-containing protein n=1 Tax=Nocardia cyriacigeorgica TaxID=135487 RepID=A0A6P1CKR1_9NOCA|nr:hypothetical protein [Nocardia cyriacigeorgica]NEW32502.1 hypothetical protein [Nocardia cyriacigeorgica]
MRFLVKVHCCGAKWLVRVPAFGVSRVVADKQLIEETAREMIAACGAAPAVFEVELDVGRYIDTREAPLVDAARSAEPG